MIRMEKEYVEKLVNMSTEDLMKVRKFIDEIRHGVGFEITSLTDRYMPGPDGEPREAADHSPG